MASKSHNTLVEKLVAELLVHRHEVIGVSYFPPKSSVKNYTHISTFGKVNSMIDNLTINSTLENSVWHYFNVLYRFESDNCRSILSIPEMRKFSNAKTKPFDLLIVETYHVQCYFPLATKVNVPIIWLLSTSKMFHADLAAGSVNNPAFVPSLTRKFMFAVSAKPTFVSRLLNFCEYVLYYSYHLMWYKPVTEDLCREFFTGVNCDLHHLYKSVSLVLTHGHLIFNSKPRMPNVVDIGGIHLQKVGQLSQVLLLPKNCWIRISSLLEIG